MATYAISDLHGALDEFTRLLERIRFRYDGSDSLYLLGDFGDWGAKSMETIQLVKSLDEKYAFVHCLMGNHEMMFLNAIEGGIVGDEANSAAVNWLVGNRGIMTWNAFCMMGEPEKEELHRWLRSLPYSYDVVIGGKRIMMAHAYPYHYDMDYAEEEIPRRQRDAVWRRLMPHEDPFASYTGARHYDGFICGHTIVQSYWRKRYLEQNPGVVDSVMYSMKNIVPGGRNRIYHGDKFIDIDCGAKCFAYSEEIDGMIESVKQAIAEQAQLAAYCLDTDVEFYVGRPGTVMSTALDGNVDVAPSLDAPEVEPVRPPARVHRAVKAVRKAAAQPDEPRRVPEPPARFGGQEAVEYPERRLPQPDIPRYRPFRRGDVDE